MKRSTIVIALAILSSACTGSSGPTTTTGAVPGSGGGSSASPLIDSVTRNQTVQDFVIHLDLSVQKDAGSGLPVGRRRCLERRLIVRFPHTLRQPWREPASGL